LAREFIEASETAAASPRLTLRLPQGTQRIAVYNFCRMHGSLKCTPAMAAGVIDKLWDMNDLYDALMDRAERKRKAARIERLIARLQRGQ
jgi:hypothetical protein